MEAISNAELVREGFEHWNQGVRILVIGSTPGKPYERPDAFQIRER